MSGLLTPQARLREFSDLGLVLPGGKLNTYVAGTPSTPQATYSDVALTVPNANPVVASAGGLFGPIYLTKGVSYKFVLTDAAGVTVWTQDNIPVPADPVVVTLPLGSIGINDFRLTLETGVPVSSADQLAKTTLFCTPSGRGNRIALCDAAGLPTIYSSAQFSIAVPNVASQLYSVFAYNNAGVPTLELAPWTNDTTPGTAAYSISGTTGTWTKTGDLTRSFQGLMRTTAVAGQTEDSVAKRYVWSYANRTRRPVRALEATDSWTYNVAAYRQANGAAANQLDVVVGVAEVLLSARVSVNVAASVATAVVVAIGEDSTTVAAAGCLMTNWAVGVNIVAVFATLDRTVPIGRHTYVWLEKTDVAGVCTLYGDNGTPLTLQSGIAGWIEG